MKNLKPPKLLLQKCEKYEQKHKSNALSDHEENFSVYTLSRNLRTLSLYLDNVEYPQNADLMMRTVSCAGKNCSKVSQNKARYAFLYCLCLFSIALAIMDLCLGYIK